MTRLLLIFTQIEEMTKVRANDTYTVMTELVMPNDTNPQGNLMGGNLLRWMDVAGSISAMKLAHSVVVTAAVDNVSFHEPIRLGDIVHIESRVSRSFNTSLEIYMVVFRQRYDSDERIKCNEAFYTFVALDSSGKPKKVPELVPEAELETKLFDGAKRRRELRLILAGRMKPGDAKELKDLFLKDVILQKTS